MAWSYSNLKRQYSHIGQFIIRRNNSKWEIPLNKNQNIFFWHEQRRCSWSLFRRSTGNNVSEPLLTKRQPQLHIGTDWHDYHFTPTHPTGTSSSTRKNDRWGLKLSRQMWMNIFLPKFFFDQNFSLTSNFLTKIILTDFFSPKFFWPKILVSKIFLTNNFCFDWNLKFFFFDQVSFHQNFLTQNFFFDQVFFWVLLLLLPISFD